MAALYSSARAMRPSGINVPMRPRKTSSCPARTPPGDSALQPLAKGKGQHDGVEPIGNGRLLVTSWTDSSLNVVEDGRVTRLAGGVPSPADVGWDPKRRHVAVPLLMEGRVEIWEVP